LQIGKLYKYNSAVWRSFAFKPSRWRILFFVRFFGLQAFLVTVLHFRQRVVLFISMDINDLTGDPDIAQFIAGFASDMVATRRQDQQRAVAQQIQTRQPQQGTITLSTRDLLDALARSNSSSQVLGAMPVIGPQHKDFPWAMIAVLGIGVGLAVGIGIAVLSKK
jgi:hypothetical protein